MKDSQLKKRDDKTGVNIYTKEEQEAIREREASTTTVDLALRSFGDMGYQCEDFDGANLDDLQKRLDGRAAERATLIAKQEALEQADNIMTPHVMSH